MDLHSRPDQTLDPSVLWNRPEMIQDLMHGVADELFRTSLSRRGFAVADLGPDVEPAQFRSTLIGFAAALDAVYQLGFSRRLILRSLGRFDQKVSTEAHLDGAPDESILLLGYEPSEVVSQLFVVDYSKCAADRGLESKEFLDRFNPTFGDGRILLEQYSTEVAPFNSRHYRVVVINNSSRPRQNGAHGMLGVLHKSTVLNAQTGQTRFINTLLLSPAGLATEDSISLADVRAYLDRGTFKST